MYRSEPKDTQKYSFKKKKKERINMDMDTRVSYYEYEPVNYFSSKKLHPVLRRFSAFLWSLVFHTRRIVSIEKFLPKYILSIE